MSGGINFKLDTASGTVGRYNSKGVQLSFKTNWSIVYYAFGVGESGQDIICSINNPSRVITELSILPKVFILYTGVILSPIFSL